MKSVSSKVLSLVFVGILIVSIFFGAVPVGAESEDNILESYEEGEKIPVIIIFKEEPDILLQRDALALVQRDGGEIKQEFHIIPAMTASMSKETIDMLSRNPKIAYIEPDYKVKVLGDSLPWGVDRVDAELVWNGTEDGHNVTPGRNAGDGIKVAILDTGIDRDHHDLDENIAGGVCFAGEQNDSKTDPEYWMDRYGHGTLCAGVIAAEDDEEGIIGIAPNASLYAVKVIGDNGLGSISDIIQGIEWCVDNDIDIASMSLGSKYHSRSLSDTCDIAYESGMLLIAAAGNFGDGHPDTTEVSYPAFYDSVIAVGATEEGDGIYYNSSTGSFLELAAPGFGVLSTYPNGTYKIINGTSIACPHVTGAAALALASDPTLSNVKVRKWLQATAEDLGEAGKDNAYGYGLVDAKGATEPGAKKIPPIIKLLSPGDESTYITINRSLIWTTDEACDWAAYSLNGAPNETVTVDTDFTAQNGANSLILYCRDLEGNIGKAKADFKVDGSIIYRFVQITDSHVDTLLPINYDGKVISHSVEIFEDSLDDIRYRHDPDTVILTGDVTDKGTISDLTRSKDLLNEKAKSWKAVAGNHDRIINATSFQTVFGEKNWSFVEEDSGSVFIGVDSTEGCGLFNPEGTVSEDQMVFLNDTLKEYSNTDKIAFVFMHHTLQYIDSDIGDLLTNSDEVNQILWSHTGGYRKIVQICGHSHLNNRTDENGVTYLVTSGIVSYPMEYRVVDIRADTINITTGGPASPEYIDLSLEAGGDPDDYGDDFDRIVDIDLVSVILPPKITSYGPSSPVIDIVGAPRTFNVTIDQVVDVTWLLNGSEVQKDDGVTEASYSNTSATSGVWNVSAIVDNINGTDIKTWIWEVEVDDQGPTVSNLAPPDGSYISTGTPEIKANYSDPSGINTSLVKIIVDDEDVTSNATITTSYLTYTPTDALNDGLHNASINVTDSSPDQLHSLVTWSFTVDTEAPQTNIASGPSGTIDHNDVTFEWGGSDNATQSSQLVYSYKLGDSWSGWTSETSRSYNDLSNGDYTFEIKAKDLANNVDETPAKRSFRVSVSSPSKSGGSSGGGGGGGFISVEIRTDSQGKVLSTYTEESSDGRAKLIIPEGTIALDADGKPLKSVSISYMPVGGTVASYNVGPNNATFDPEIELIINFDSEDAKNKDMAIKVYRDGKWTELETMIDYGVNRASVKISHFTVFALFKGTEEIVTTTTETTKTLAEEVPPSPTITPTPPVSEEEGTLVIPWIWILVTIIAYVFVLGLALIIERRR
ncbi:MAG: S8 family serine peptidase [Halobacteriota archaeon]|nr:S8 family serine peptidase [Halobacteriota archaeon]